MRDHITVVCELHDTCTYNGRCDHHRPHTAYNDPDNENQYHYGTCVFRVGIMCCCVSLSKIRKDKLNKLQSL